MGFEPTISASERPQTYALDRAATGIGHKGPIGNNPPHCGRVTRDFDVASLKTKLRQIQLNIQR